MSTNAEWEAIRQGYEERWAALNAQDQAAKAAGTLVGRFITHPIADGKAVYEIVKVTKRTAHIQVVTGIGDDWVVPAWGMFARINLKTAQEFVNRRDRLDALFGGRTAIKVTPEILEELKR